MLGWKYPCGFGAREGETEINEREVGVLKAFWVVLRTLQPILRSVENFEQQYLQFCLSAIPLRWRVAH